MKPEETKPKLTTSIRLDPPIRAAYTRLIEGADLSVSEDLRSLVGRSVTASEQVDLKGFKVDCSFHWQEPVDRFPEHVGNMLVTVTPPESIPTNVFQRMVFVIPEFWSENNGLKFEPFRIDSAYFHRVTAAENLRTSPKINRNVLSFYLIEGQWRAAMFKYSTGVEVQSMEAQIREAITHHVTSTVVCYLIGHLPPSRLISQELLTQYQESLTPETRSLIQTI